MVTIYSERKAGNVAIFVLVGVDRSCESEDTILDRVHEAINKHQIKHIVLDIEKSSSTSKFIGILMKIRAVLENYDGRLILVNPSPKITKLLTETGLKDFFTICGSEEAALAHLAS